MAGDDAGDMVDLPARLAKAEEGTYADVTITEIWNTASPAHMSGVHTGWEYDVNAFSYHDSSWQQQFAGGLFGWLGYTLFGLFGEHTSMYYDQEVWDIMADVIPD